MVLSTLFFVGCRKEDIKPVADLPPEIKMYITTHYSSQSIIETEIDLTDSTNAYEIKLNNGTSLEFNYKKVIMDIDGHTELPTSVISIKMFDYVRIHYPNNFITGWEMDEGCKQEIELNNNMDLEFDMNNEFLGCDCP